jgi:hypothetical protein
MNGRFLESAFENRSKWTRIGNDGFGENRLVFPSVGKDRNRGGTEIASALLESYIF